MTPDLVVTPQRLLDEVDKLAEDDIYWNNVYNSLEDSLSARLRSRATKRSESFVNYGMFPEGTLRALSFVSLGDFVNEETWADELNNEIHPVLAKENWAGKGPCRLTKKRWAQLEPVLRLASLMLNTVAAREWFRNVATANIKVDETDDVKYLETPSKASRQERTTKEAWETMTGVLKLEFCLLVDGDENTEGMFSPGQYKVWLKVGLLNALEHLNMPLRFSLAVTIVHELAHAFYYTARQSGEEEIDLHEPRYGKDALYAEIGRSFEQTVLGHSWNYVAPHGADDSGTPFPLLEIKHSNHQSAYGESLEADSIRDWPEEP